MKLPGIFAKLRQRLAIVKPQPEELPERVEPSIPQVPRPAVKDMQKALRDRPHKRHK